MTDRRFGVIAEDDTDYQTARVIIHRVRGAQTTVKKRFGQGCSDIKRKAESWMRQLASAGCSDIIILHDLDRNPVNGTLNSATDLKAVLQTKVVLAGITRLICIPIEELEAWFWADPSVVKKVGRGSGTASANPERIERPKEKLERLSYGENRKPFYSTNENPDLAEALDLELCAKRCPSFAQLLEFLK